MHYLLKTEPSQYSFNDLQREREAVWDGVTNPAAVKHLRGMKKGDRLVIYHTGSEKRVAGVATVASVAVEDPRQPRVTIRARAALRPVTLVEIKASPLFGDSPLLKQGRLSVVPLSDAQYRFLAGKPLSARKRFQ